MSMKRVMASLIVMLAMAGCEEGSGDSSGSGQSGGSPNSDSVVTSTDQAVLDKAKNFDSTTMAGQNMVGSIGASRSYYVLPLGSLDRGSPFAATGFVDQSNRAPARSAANPEPLTAMLSGLALVALGLKVHRRASQSS